MSDCVYDFRNVLFYTSCLNLFSNGIQILTIAKKYYKSNCGIKVPQSDQIKNHYTGWPRKNATLTINNFKKTTDRMNKLCALLCIKFFFQQDDPKIVNFDEGVLILEPFSEAMSFSICAPFVSKVTSEVGRNFFE